MADAARGPQTPPHPRIFSLLVRNCLVRLRPPLKIAGDEGNSRAQPQKGERRREAGAGGRGAAILPSVSPHLVVAQLAYLNGHLLKPRCVGIDDPLCPYHFSQYKLKHRYRGFRELLSL